LAQHRCEETISDIFNLLSGKFSELHHMIETDELEKAIKTLKSFVQAANDEYFERLHRYPIHVVQTKGEVLQRRINELIEPLFQNYCNKIEKKSLKIFELDLKSSNKQFSENSLKESIQRALVFYRTSIQGTQSSLKLF
jgi:glutamyl-tRNA reductase